MKLLLHVLSFEVHPWLKLMRHVQSITLLPWATIVKHYPPLSERVKFQACKWQHYAAAEWLLTCMYLCGEKP
jgi:hypothetical protein